MCTANLDKLRGPCWQCRRHPTASPSSRSSKAKLLEHERLIELLPAFLHLSADYPIDDQPVDGNSLAGRRRWAKWPIMRPSGVPAERDQVTLNQLILDGEMQIGKGLQQGGNELLPRTDTTEGFNN